MGGIHFLKEKNARAEELGYSSFALAVRYLYAKHKSLSKVVKIFCADGHKGLVSDNGITLQLERMGIQRGQKGGDNRSGLRAQKTGIKYEAEKNEIAVGLGYKNYLDAIKKMYLSGMSGRIIAYKFDVTSQAIFYRLRIMNIKRKPRGYQKKNG